MKPVGALRKEPIFMISYKKPTENTVRIRNEVAYLINAGQLKLKEYTESDFIVILEELTEATSKLEQQNV